MSLNCQVVWLKEKLIGYTIATSSLEKQRDILPLGHQIASLDKINWRPENKELSNLEGS